MTDSPQDTPTPQPTADTSSPTLQSTADTSSSSPDLDRIERDLAAVEAALPRLDDGSYWIDEVTGADIPDDVHAADPVARRA